MDEISGGGEMAGTFDDFAEYTGCGHGFGGLEGRIGGCFSGFGWGSGIGEFIDRPSCGCRNEPNRSNAKYDIVVTDRAQIKS